MNRKSSVFGSKIKKILVIFAEKFGVIPTTLGKSGAINPIALEEDFARLLIPEEKIELGLIGVGEAFVLTNLRLLFVDGEHDTGEKSQYMSIPYRKVTAYGIEPGNGFDKNAELTLWIQSWDQPIEYKFNERVNIYELQMVLAKYVL